ncbi:unnamed protein product [Protopolystoma xenopodis]|uniref:Uncharacterized protein n=1 Tax=Protopolystoma xenopodis TaxID=117903 RepID=A0A448X5Y2_9PLAT|nr:unnamed protein product [Protopolystoma xenopodis]
MFFKLPFSIVALHVLSEFYQRCGRYYSTEGWTGDVTSVGVSTDAATGSGGNIGDAGDSNEGGSGGTASGCAVVVAASGGGSVAVATEEERGITAQLFSLIFDNLAQQPYDPELFSYALPCLCAIGCALPPDYCNPKATPEDPMGLGVSAGRSGAVGVLSNLESHGMVSIQIANGHFFLYAFHNLRATNQILLLNVRSKSGFR